MKADDRKFYPGVGYAKYSSVFASNSYPITEVSTATHTSTVWINEPDLFGGQTSQGGILGYVCLSFGESDLLPNSYLQGQYSSPTPAYRGVFSVILPKIFMCANNPYIKNWSFRVRKYPSPGWYDATQRIWVDGGCDANPAHMIRELFTSDAYGLGKP